MSDSTIGLVLTALKEAFLVTSRQSASSSDEDSDFPAQDHPRVKLPRRWRKSRDGSQEGVVRPVVLSGNIFSAAAAVAWSDLTPRERKC